MAAPTAMEHEAKASEDSVSYVQKSSRVLLHRGGPSRARCEMFGKGADGRNRVVILCLGLLDVVLLVAAVALGIAFTQRPDTKSQPAAAHLIAELDHLFGNHSDAMEAMQEAVNMLNRETRSHKKLKVKVKEQKSANDVYQRQLERFRRERKILQFNVSALEGSCGKCNKGWIFFNSSCYYFSYSNSSASRKDWMDSRNDCINRGADLVVIDHQKEQSYISQIIESLRTYHFEVNGLWIGVTYKKTEGTWIWINNVTEAEQRYWMPGEPNNSQGQHCGATVYSSTQPWETRFGDHCDSHFHWICEMLPKF
ncbi:CD209 antigen-like protein E isoform X2 [Corythoichthys intestinalis]|uniref:CD209 antigen-like protein E isoform X2 n=1 Tax=Corythoichthys intestinalis TaxID=161448 RepID=UPI0025A54524|nr:CD209 antigen-like protein E isoform X2 [Corythoichthys intestinalis]